MRPPSSPSALAICHTLKCCSKNRRTLSAVGFESRVAAAHVSRHASRFASGPQLAMNACHASASASSRQPGSSANVAALNDAPPTGGVGAGAAFAEGSVTETGVGVTAGGEVVGAGFSGTAAGGALH